MGKIGIFLPGQNGDIMSAMSVLKYKNELWPDKDVVWFCARSLDLFKHNDAISEIRHWPEGWGLPERCKVDGPLAVARGEPMWEDFSVLKTATNRLDQNLKHNFASTKDLDDGFFPAPHQMTLQQRYGVDYPNISRKVFGAPHSWEWHPYLCFSDEEREAVRDFCSKLPHKKTVMLETSFGSGKSPWDDNLTRDVMRICRNKFGPTNFIFACAGDNSRFYDDVGVVSCSHFTVRQTALVNNYCDLFIGISSGISVATSCWGNKPVPKIQYCGSFIMSTVSLAVGPIDLITTDPAGQNPPEHEKMYPPNPNHRQIFKWKLADVLHKL